MLERRAGARELSDDSRGDVGAVLIKNTQAWWQSIVINFLIFLCRCTRAWQTVAFFIRLSICCRMNVQIFLRYWCMVRWPNGCCVVVCDIDIMQQKIECSLFYRLNRVPVLSQSKWEQIEVHSSKRENLLKQIMIKSSNNYVDNFNFGNKVNSEGA